ncbi:hypothetical protein ACA081_01130 [Candidatus Hodgkinia cicadicola]
MWLSWLSEECVIEDNMGLLDCVMEAYVNNTCCIFAFNQNKLILILNCLGGLQTGVCAAGILSPLVSGIILNNISSYKQEIVLLRELKCNHHPIVLGVFYSQILLEIKRRHLGVVHLCETRFKTASYLKQLSKWTYCTCNTKRLQHLLLVVNITRDAVL